MHQILLLRHLGYTFVALSDLNHLIELPRKSCLITFDDGYRSVAKLAYPFLKEQGIPAAYFITTGQINAEEGLPDDRLRLIIQNMPPDGNGGIEDLIDHYAKLNQLKTVQTVKNLRLHFRSIASYDEQLQLISDIESHFDIKKDNNFWQRFYLDWNDLKEMQDIFEYASHTKHHILLSQHDTARQCDEIMLAHEELEHHLLAPKKWFCYPYGYMKSFNEETISILMSMGFYGAFTTLPANNSIPFDKAFQIGRFTIENQTIDEFLYFIRG